MVTESSLTSQLTLNNRSSSQEGVARGTTPRTLLDLLPSLGALTDMIEQRIADDIAIVDVLNLAEGVLVAVGAVDHEKVLMSSNDSSWQIAQLLSTSEQRGTRALGTLLTLQAVARSPDVTMQLIQRLYDELLAALVD